MIFYDYATLFFISKPRQLSTVLFPLQLLLTWGWLSPFLGTSNFSLTNNSLSIFCVSLTISRVFGVVDGQMFSVHKYPVFSMLQQQRLQSMIKQSFGAHGVFFRSIATGTSTEKDKALVKYIQDCSLFIHVHVLYLYTLRSICNRYQEKIEFVFNLIDTIIGGIFAIPFGLYSFHSLYLMLTIDIAEAILRQQYKLARGKISFLIRLKL